MKKYLILPDVHTPFHDKIILEKIYKMLKVVKVDGLVITGDFLDLYSLGSYNANSLKLLSKWNLSDEYEVGNQVLRDILQAVGRDCKERYFIFGNHEDRYFRELAKGDNAKYGNALQNPTDALNLHAKGFQVVEDWKDGFVKLGKMVISHGFYTNVHVTKKALDMYQENCIFGHSHRFSSFIDGRIGAWNIGFLGNKDSEGFKYMHRGQRNQWCNGFAFYNVLDNDEFIVEPIQIWNRSFLYGGVKY